MTTTTGANGRISVHLSDPGDILAAIPHLLSFRPGPSMVLLSYAPGRERRIATVIRADLPDDSGEPDAVRALVLSLLRHPGAGVSVVIIGRGPGHRAPPGEVPHRRLAHRLVDALQRAGRPVDHALWVRELRGGAPWRCYVGQWPPGTLPDPGGTVLAAAVVRSGRVTFDSREELERLLAPDDPAVIDQRQRMLDEAVASLAERSPTAAIQEAEDVVRAALARAVEGDYDLSDADVVSLAMALSDHRIRDRCLTTATPSATPGADAAERLWLELVRRTPPPERAEPAVLLAHAAYLRGDGVLAGHALETALEADPGHRLAELLSLALTSHLPPETVRRLGETQQGGLMPPKP